MFILFPLFTFNYNNYYLSVFSILSVKQAIGLYSKQFKLYTLRAISRREKTTNLEAIGSLGEQRHIKSFSSWAALAGRRLRTTVCQSWKSSKVQHNMFSTWKGLQESRGGAKQEGVGVNTQGSVSRRDINSSCTSRDTSFSHRLKFYSLYIVLSLHEQVSKFYRFSLNESTRKPTAVVSHQAAAVSEILQASQINWGLKWN